MATRSVSTLDENTFRAYLLCFLLDAKRRGIDISEYDKEVAEYVKANDLPA